MGVKADLRDLEHFMDRLKKAKTLNKDFANKVSNAVADKGVELAKDAYSGTKVNTSGFHKDEAINGVSAVVAEAEGLAFVEYGTGYYADGTYKGKTPESGVPITGDWQYWYQPSPYKAIVDGEKGWFTNLGDQSGFNTGHNAGNQMYNVAQQLGTEGKEARKKAIEIINEQLKGTSND